MKRITLALVVVLASSSLLWWLADPILLQGKGFFPIRNLIAHYTGVVAMAVMSVGMVLALRPGWLEPALGGLDKAYRLHKWLGITGLVLAVVHWLAGKGPKWAVGWGWLERPQRGPRPEQTVELFRFFQEQRGIAEAIGEWAFYAFVVLAAIALLKRFPYRRFFQTHRLLAVTYLALVVHGVVLLPFGYWSAPLGVVMGLLMAGGSYAATMSLLGRIGRGRRAEAEIETVNAYPDSGVLEVALRLKSGWPGHRSGQFAFVTFDPQEGPHPFTIASAWQDDGRLTFVIKALGDYTRRLSGTLKIGAPVRLEGPYGRFDFDGGPAGQIWVAGGVGITPFLARLQDRALAASRDSVDLFYCVSKPDEHFLAKLRELAERAKVRLHVRVDARDGLLDADAVCRAVPAWRRAGVWFCGPAKFGAALRRALGARGISSARFHQELFEMR